MIRTPKLVVSRPMYSFDPDTWRAERREVRAAWFRRKNGKILAAMGTYHPVFMRHNEDPPDDTYLAWIEAANDNRYGGNHWSSWDGETLLTTDPPSLAPADAAERTAFLDAMLRGFPNPPAGYDGWWTFPRKA